MKRGDPTFSFPALFSFLFTPVIFIYEKLQLENCFDFVLSRTWNQSPVHIELICDIFL